jgi:hypothetical protein
LTERPCEGIEEAFLRFIDFRNAENIIDITDDGNAFLWDKIRCAVAEASSFYVSVEPLNLLCFVAICQAIAVDRYEYIKVAFACRKVPVLLGRTLVYV